MTSQKILPQQIIELERHLAPLQRKMYVCPDGLVRQLVSYEVTASDVSLFFVSQTQGGSRKYNYATAEFEKRFDQFSEVDPRLAPQSQTEPEPKPAPNVPVPPVAITAPTVVESPQLPAPVQEALPVEVSELQNQTNAIIGSDTISDLTQMLMEVAKAAKRDPKAVAQANAVNNVAKSVIDLKRLQLEAMKTLHQIKTKQKEVQGSKSELPADS